MPNYTTDWTFITSDKQGEFDILINFEYEEAQINYPYEPDSPEIVYDFDFEFLAHRIYDSKTNKYIDSDLPIQYQDDAMTDFNELFDDCPEIQEKVGKICLDYIHQLQYEAARNSIECF